MPCTFTWYKLYVYCVTVPLHMYCHSGTNIIVLWCKHILNDTYNIGQWQPFTPEANALVEDLVILLPPLIFISCCELWTIDVSDLILFITCLSWPQASPVIILWVKKAQCNECSHQCIVILPLTRGLFLQ